MITLAKSQISILGSESSIAQENSSVCFSAREGEEKGYSIAIIKGTRGVAYSSNGTLPDPGISREFSVVLFQDGKEVEPQSCSWSCGGIFSMKNEVEEATSFTPNISEVYSEETSYVRVVLNGSIEQVVPIVAIRHGEALDWIYDWNGTATMIGDNKIITPKLFAGTYNPTLKELTGTAIGQNILQGGSASKTDTGIISYKKNVPVFQVDQNGNVFIGDRSKKHISLSSDGSALIPKIIADNIESLNGLIVGPKDKPSLEIDDEGAVSITSYRDDVPVFQLGRSGTVIIGDESKKHIRLATDGSIQIPKIVADNIESLNGMVIGPKDKPNLVIDEVGNVSITSYKDEVPVFQLKKSGEVIIGDTEKKHIKLNQDGSVEIPKIVADNIESLNGLIVGPKERPNLEIDQEGNVTIKSYKDGVLVFELDQNGTIVMGDREKDHIYIGPDGACVIPAVVETTVTYTNDLLKKIPTNGVTLLKTALTLTAETDVVMHFTATIVAEEDSNVQITIKNNGQQIVFSPTQTVRAGYNLFSFTTTLDKLSAEIQNIFLVEAKSSIGEVIIEPNQMSILIRGLTLQDAGASQLPFEGGEHTEIINLNKEIDVNIKSSTTISELIQIPIQTKGTHTETVKINPKINIIT